MYFTTKTIITLIYAALCGLGAYLLFLEYLALNAGHFSRTFLWGVLCLLCSGILAVLLKQKWLSAGIHLVFFVTGLGLYSQIFSGRDLFTLFFFQFGYAVALWVLISIIFLRLKTHRRLYLVCFAGSLALYVILWLGGFNFGNFHDSAIPSTFIWTCIGMLLMGYGSLLNLTASQFSNK